MRSYTRRVAVFVGVVLWTACAASLAAAQGPDTRGLYVPPAGGFIHDPAETPVVLEFGATPLALVQKALDAARLANPDTPIVLTLTGTYTVTDVPLTLTSRTSLVLYGSITAGAGVSATSLIAVAGQREVGIAGGVLDGRGADLAGIRVDASAKINIDAVTVRNTGRDGIFLSGQGNDVWNSGSAITRCEVAGARGSGITIAAITQALVIDNFVRNSTRAGIQVSAAHSSIVNNVALANDVGIIVDANDALVSDNGLRSNRGGGLQLKSTSAGAAVLRNAVIDNAIAGIDAGGANHLIYANQLANPVDLIDRAAGNWIVARGTPLQAPVSRYFYPPTIDNRHTDPIMNGRTRVDLAIDASASPVISGVQQAYDAARQQHPDAVIVLTLTGEFTLDGSPLLLQSRTALILDGAINVPAANRATEAIRGGNPSEFISISGGTLDLGGPSREGIFFPSTTMAYVDGVRVQRGGQRDVRAGKGMIHLARGGGYAILRGNTIDTSGGRCIWTQNTNTRFVALDNYSTNCNQDGVDFDSSTRNSVALSNISVDNVRYGVFIEQSAAFNKAYGNVATTRGLPGIPGRGMNVYNNATGSGVRGVTDKNTMFANVTDVIANGLRVGSISTATGGVAETRHTFMFNNIVRNIRSDGILFDTEFPRSVQNYFSQTVFENNGRDLRFVPDDNPDPALRATPPEFFNPRSAINLAWRQPVVSSSSAPDSSPQAAVDGLGYTSWVAEDKQLSWLTVDLGSETSFGRVVLRRVPGGVTARVALQVSQDGVTFTSAPGLAREIVMSQDLLVVRFSAVAARFVRVEVRGFTSRPVGFAEVAVHPK